MLTDSRQVICRDSSVTDGKKSQREMGSIQLQLLKWRKEPYLKTKQKQVTTKGLQNFMVEISKTDFLILKNNLFLPWLGWLSGLSATLCTKGPLV